MSFSVHKRKYICERYLKVKKALQSENVDDAELQKVMQVYLDLAESKDWWNVEVVPVDSTVVKLVVTGHETQHEDRAIVLPIHSHVILSMQDIEIFKKTLKEKFNVNSFQLAIVDADSTVIYHTLSDGLVPPESPDQLKAKKQKRIRYQNRRKQRHMKWSQTADTIAVKASTKERKPSSQSCTPSLTIPSSQLNQETKSTCLEQSSGASDLSHEPSTSRTNINSEEVDSTQNDRKFIHSHSNTVNKSTENSKQLEDSVESTGLYSTGVLPAVMEEFQDVISDQYDSEDYDEEI